jgi:hypothetical protein
MGGVQAVARTLHSFPARCDTRCRQTRLSGYALASLLESTRTREKVWKQFTTVVASISSKVRTREEERPKSSSTVFFSGRPESIKLFLEVSTRALSCSTSLHRS